jgi:hypothetical protein
VPDRDEFEMNMSGVGNIKALPWKQSIQDAM